MKPEDLPLVTGRQRRLRVIKRIVTQPAFLAGLVIHVILVTPYWDAPMVVHLPVSMLGSSFMWISVFVGIRIESIRNRARTMMVSDATLMAATISDDTLRVDFAGGVSRLVNADGEVVAMSTLGGLGSFAVQVDPGADETRDAALKLHGWLDHPLTIALLHPPTPAGPDVGIVMLSAAGEMLTFHGIPGKFETS